MSGIGSFVAEHLRVEGLSVKQVAKRSHLSKKKIRRFLRGRGENLRLRELDKLLSVVGLPFDVAVDGIIPGPSRFRAA